jgi:Rhodopirellula transposase DDE domain
MRECKNVGRELQVQVHDFAIPEIGRAISHDVYNLGTNTWLGEVMSRRNLRVETMRGWWRWMGQQFYPRAKRLLTDAGRRQWYLAAFVED